MNSGVLSLGRIGPIPIYAHWTALLLVYLAWSWSSGDNLLFSALLLNLVLGILLHECGHGLTALFFKARQVTITLWAFGGVCASQNRVAKPKQALAILIAGPAVSYILAGIGQLGLILYTPDSEPNTFLITFLFLMKWINLMLALFNSVPLFPLDGGQIIFQLQLMFKVPIPIAKKVSLILAFICAAMLLVWMNFDLIQGSPNASVNWFGLAVVLFLLQSSWAELRR